MKNNFFKVVILFFVFIFISCRQEINDGRFRETFFDQIRIPDKFNTGTKSGTDFKKLNATDEIGANVVLQKRIDENKYVLSSYSNNLEKFPNVSVIENYDFSDMDFVVYSSDRYPVNKKIIFRNCKFKGFNNSPSEGKGARIYFEFYFCDFSGNVSSSYISLNDCKIGGFTNDGMNPLTEFYANRLYIYNLMCEARPDEVHVDGFQIYGDYRAKNNEVDGHWISKINTGNVHLKNVRFEIPSINFAGNASYVNACIMFQLEFSDVDNVSFENMFVNGGGKHCPIFLDSGKNNEKSVHGNWSHKNLSLKNAYVSDNFGNIYYSDLLQDAVRKNVDHYSNVYITSVWKDPDGKVHIIASNDTRTDATITVKTNVGTFSFDIPHCPSNWALNGEVDNKTNPTESLVDKNGRQYTTYRWEDFPFDKEFKFDGNPDFVLCYQGDTLLSYKSLDGKPHYAEEVKE